MNAPALPARRAAARQAAAEAAGTAALVAVVVGSCIGAAHRFTSSTNFANPAVTIGRAFTDTYTCIAPASVAPFLAAQLAGAGAGVGVGVGVGVGLVLVALTFGRPAPATGYEVVVPHGERHLAAPARPAEESTVSS